MRTAKLPVWACQVAYYTTSINPALSVLQNKYTGINHPLRVQHDGLWDTTTANVYKTLFYFARLKPRLLFVIGSCLRALQLCTVISYVFDPPIGVGAGLNLLALLTASQWPAPLVVGWAVSKPVWRLLRAEPPPAYGVNIPIKVAMPGGGAPKK